LAYCDYDFYRNVYLGNAISAEDFPQLSERASDYIRAATKGISDTVDGGQLEAVKKCTCAVADVLLDESIMTASVYSGKAQVSSETVGPWSRSFKTVSLSGTEVEHIRARKVDAIMLYLGGLAAFSGLFLVRSYPCVH